VGDLNNDPRLDLVVANPYSNDVSVLLGDGNGSFDDQTTYSAGDFPVYVAVGDLNNDARLDLVVANSQSNDVSVLLGNGNGSFSNQTRYPAYSSPEFVAVGDLNNDTRLDLVVANVGSNDVSVLLGDGNGSFANQTRYPAGTRPYSVAVGDFNNDARLDLVVANRDSNDVSVLLGDGNGSFGNQTRYAAGSTPQSVAVVDLNNDTRLELVVANTGSHDVSVLLGYDYIAFVKETTLMTGNGSRPTSVLSTDFNNDGLMDIAVLDSRYYALGIFLSCGSGCFTDQLLHSTRPSISPCALAAGDFNNDTRMDVVVAGCDSASVDVFFGHGNGSLGNLKTFPIGAASSRYSLAVSDINDDATLDVVITNFDYSYLGVLRGYGDGTFADIIQFPLGYGTHPFSVVVGDFNNDRKKDVAIANQGSDSLSILLQTC
jgi:hypothetical protein